ncbi:NmrA/HSCARG family protein [Tersicoccus sp. MR15.9]|uniref:NmrA/HSCARG family protein n=1 Tax=Tersicoccus mangrovi TaxID=3121635 RepID=UPI002FE54810
MTPTPGTDSPIAVVGATGQQGGSVVDALLERGANVRALVRDPQAKKAHALAERGVELSQGDVTDPASLDALFDGVSAAYAMTTMAGPDGIQGEVTSGIAIADAAARARLPHLVFSSVGGAERNTGIPHFESKRRVEERIESLGLHATIVRPVYFMENLAGFGVSVEDGEVVVRMALPDGVPLQMVAVRDIGRVAAVVLLGGTDVEGGSIEIAGDSRTGSEIARAVGEHAGLPARFESLPLGALPNEDMTAMFRWFVETPAYKADIDQVRTLDPELLDLPAWLAQSGWTPGR